MTSERARVRCRERIEKLAGSTLDSVSLRREAIADLKRTIGFDRWCVPLVDPDALTAYAGVAETDHIADLDRLQLYDASLAEANNGVAVARRRDRVGLLSRETAGDLARSRRWRETLERYGTGDELRVVARDERACWARFDLWRDAADRPFDEADAQLLSEIAASLGHGLRRSAALPTDTPATAPPDSGVLLVDDQLRVRGRTATVPEWSALLNPTRAPYKDGIPSVVWSTVGRLVAAERGEDPQRPAQTRMRAADGRWAVVEAARLDGAPGLITVSIHPAGLAQILDLVVRAHALTRREADVVGRVVDGLDTRAIARALQIRPYTVQEHLRSAFGKIGVHSRLELLTRVLAQIA